MHSVLIDRLQLDVRATASHDRAEALKRRLRTAVASQLADALARKLDLRHPSSRQVFIDEIRIGCAVQSRWDDEAIAAAIAERLAATLAEPAAGSIVFRDRTEYVAAALVALADGVMHQRWYFEAFDGLRSLTTSQALRTLLCDPSEDSVAVLARLTASGRTRVLECIDDADLARVLHGWRQRGRGRAAVEVIWAAAMRSPATCLRSAVAATLGAQPDGDFGSDSVDACVALAQLAMGLIEGSVSWSPPDSATAAELTALVASLDVPTEWIARIDPDAVKRLSEAIAARTEPGRARPQDSQREVHRTAFGGAFVLVVIAHWLGWPGLFARAFGQHGVQGANRRRMTHELLLRIVASALVPARSGVVRSDIALRRALGVGPVPVRLAPPMLRTALSSVLDDAPADATVPIATRPAITRAAERLLNTLSERVPACPGSSAGYLRRNLLSMSASVAIDDNAAGGMQTTVCLGNAPLSVLLHLAGITRATVELPGSGTTAPGWRLRMQSEGWR